MQWDFHGVTVRGKTDAPAIRDRWKRAFASRPASVAAPDIVCNLQLGEPTPLPDRAPDFRQDELLQYYIDGETTLAHFPRFGQLRLDFAERSTLGTLTPAALENPAAFEDLLAVALSPHLRRRGYFLLHAFAAATRGRGLTSAPGRALLIVGKIGAGKTTTGMALLASGWQLLSNDSPIVSAGGGVLSYPGLLAAYPDTLRRFAATESIAAPESVSKIVFSAEQVWPDVWTARAPAGVIVFPQIENRSDHAFEPIAPPEALERLLPHAVEQWDREMMPAHLRVLRELVEAASAYRLRLGLDVHALPELLADLVR